MRGSCSTGARRVRAKIDAAPERFPINVPSASAGALVKSVIVRAEIDLNGNVWEEELADSALDLVKNIKFPAEQTQRQACANVRYLPESQ